MPHFIKAGNWVSRARSYKDFLNLEDLISSVIPENISGGVGISYDNITGVITNSLPDLTTVLNNGTGILVSGMYPNFTITNSLPDQTVVLTQGTNITISGTYPNFTINATSSLTNGFTVFNLN